MKSIQIDKDIRDYLLAKGMGAGQSASEILRRELLFTVEIDDDLYAFLASLAINVGESVPSILRRELHIQGAQPGPVDPPPVNPPPVGPPPAARIEFHIQAGTGAAAWNTYQQTVEGVVGQTLRIYNDDAVGHRLHTNNNPFPHPATEIPPGGFSDFVLQTAYVSSAQQTLYDHNFGPAAQFWINVQAA